MEVEKENASPEEVSPAMYILSLKGEFRRNIMLQKRDSAAKVRAAVS